MKYPNIINMTPGWVLSISETQVRLDGEDYVPARHRGYPSILTALGSKLTFGHRDF
jgi:hypothetical protein